MIPRSDRVLFHFEGSPPAPAKQHPISFDRAKSTPSTQPAMRWNGAKRITVTKDPHKMRVLAPATPWRPRISRKTPASPADDRPEQASPLDRKLPASIMPLQLGVKPEAGMLSSAPTSATLAPACDKEEPMGEDKVDACRREAEPATPAAPRLEQREELHGDRWGMLRSDGNYRAGWYDRGSTSPSVLMGSEPALYALPSRSALGLSNGPFQSSTRRADACAALDINNDSNIYVNGLPKEMNDHTLYLLGSACGVVISHKAMMDRHTGLCKGFGFLMYASSEMAKRAIEWLNSHGFTASIAKESFSARLRRMADNSTTNVYLSNLPVKFTEQQLEQLFNPHPIASLKILYDVHGESRGVGFVRLYDRATARLCIERLHGRVLPGTTLPLQVRFADSEAQKQLKHSVHQKHTLESLGLLSKLDDAMARYHLGMDGDVGPLGHEEMFRARTTSSVDTAAGRGSRYAATTPGRAFDGASPAFPQPFIPAAVASMPVPTFAPNGTHQSSGLGIDMPSHVMYPPTQAGPMMNPALWASVPTARVMYSGMEGSYALDRGHPLSPIVTGMWDETKAREAEAAYLPISLFPPPGLAHPAHRPPFEHHPHHPATANATATSNAHTRSARKTQPHGAAVRVRFPVGGADTGTRAVSDPMAMLAAQARVREALGLPDRVRAAVSADNSIAETDADESSDTSPSSEEESSLSIDIQVHADPR